MKKMLSIVIIGFFILSGFGVAGIAEDQTNNYTVYEGRLDQIQNLTSALFAVGAVGNSLNFSIAQEFTPSKSILTRVELFIKNEDLDATYPIILAIRDNITGDNLRSVKVEPEDVGNNLSWVEFDFEDIKVTIGQSYYIVLYTKRLENNSYHCGWYYPDPYPNGTSYVRLEPEDPYIDTEGDFTFKTYGLDSTSLAIDFEKSVLSVSAIIENIGDVDAYDVEINIEVTGGILGLINRTLNLSEEIINPNMQKTVDVRNLIGFGPLRVVVTASAVNADEITESWEGLIIIFFIF
jgi:hypothetical protein